MINLVRTYPRNIYLNREEIILESGKLLIKMWRSVIEDSNIAKKGIKISRGQ